VPLIHVIHGALQMLYYHYYYYYYYYYNFSKKLHIQPQWTYRTLMKSIHWNMTVSIIPVWWMPAVRQTYIIEAECAK